VGTVAGVSTGPIVLRHGVVKGKGREAKCDVLARKIPVVATHPGRPGSPEYTYSDCAVIDAPFDLPDGEYLMHFDDHIIAATKQGAYWLSRGVAKKYREPILPVSSWGF
jgi:hypothetical protein